MKEIKIRVKKVGGFSGELPQYKTAGSVGVDLTANLDSSLTIRPMERVLIPTGIAVEIPDGYEGQVRPRSGLALKHGVTTVNTPGTIDSDYRGEIGAIMVNLGNSPFEMNPGDRIAQLVISPVVRLVWEDVDELSDTERGEGGFGSSGK